MSLRDFPPVEPVEKPQRYSQTLLRKFDTCQRSAYLYLKHHGGVPSHDLDRGTAFHLFAERAIRLMVEQGEPIIPPELAKDLMAEVVAEHTDLTVPARDQDRLREMAWHFSQGVAIEPAEVIAIERKFVFPLERGTVSGKIDFASMSEDGTVATIWDWKTSWAMADQDELGTKLDDGRISAKAFQLLLYVLLLAYGHPVTERECEECGGFGTVVPPGEVLEVGPGTVIRDPTCPTCEGRGKTESLEPPLGERVQVFNCAEMYPRYLFDDGLGRREVSVTRAELLDHRIWLEGLVAKVEASLESWKLPAVPGSHCSECPASAECPLPEHLRSHRGSINSMEQAVEAAEKLHVDGLDFTARKAELRNFSNLHGPIRYGRDLVFEFQEQESEDWVKGKRIGRPDSAAARAAMEDALKRSIEYGEDFRYEDFRRKRTSTRFVSRRLAEDELQPDPEPVDLDAKYGAEAPW